MSETIDRIVAVAKFADAKSDINSSFQTVQFTKGRVAACSYEGGASMSIDVDVKAVVAASILLKVCKAMPNAELSMTEPEKGSKERPRLQLRQGESVAVIDTQPDQTAPRIPKPAKKATWHEVSGLDELARVAWCCCADPTRRHMAGVYLGQYGMAATDGHAAVMLQTPGDLTKELGENGQIVPPAMMKGLGSPVMMTSSGRQLFFAEDPSSGDFRVANCYDGRFPPLDQAMKGVWKQPKMEVPRVEFEDMVKSAKLADKNLVLAVEGQRLRVVVDRGRMVQTLFDFESAVSFEGKVPPGYIGFGAHLVLPALQACDSDTIQVFLNPHEKGSIEPMGIRDGGYKVVIMPTRM